MQISWKIFGVFSGFEFFQPVEHRRTAAGPERERILITILEWAATIFLCSITKQLKQISTRENSFHANKKPSCFPLATAGEIIKFRKSPFLANIKY